MSNGIFNFNFLALLLSEILGGPNLHQGALRPLGAPQRRNFVPKASTSQCLIVLFISTFQLQQFPRFQGVQIYVRGFCAPCTPPSEKFFYTRGEYVTMSNGVFNFNFLAFVCSEILRVSQIYTRGPYAPWTPPSGKIFSPKKYFTISNCNFNFNILALVVTEILGGPTFTLWGPVPPSTPLAEIFLHPRRVRYYV